MDYKSIFDKVKDQSSFIKTSEKLVIESNQKVTLNRKGNVLFNSGDIEGARRIFQTTGYSDGLVRVGDYYKKEGRELDALRMYWIAPDRNKAEPLIAKLSAIIQNMLQDERNETNE